MLFHQSFQVCAEICVTFLFFARRGERKGGSSELWLQLDPAKACNHPAVPFPTASTPHLHQLAWRVIFYMLFWSNSDMPQRQQNTAEKPLMKENETLLMPDNVNQQIAERSLTQRCHGSPAGPPQLEVRRHLSRTNDCKSLSSSLLRMNAAQSLRQQGMDTIMLQAWHAALKHLFM